LTPAVGRSPFSELSLSSSDTPFCTSIALGLPVLLLALLALGQSLGRRLWLVALLCVLASLGSALPVERALLFLLPPLRVFRYSEKWLAPAAFLLTLAAALGADALARSRKLVPALLGLATALGLVGLGAHGSQALVRFVAQHMHGGREAVAALTAQDLSRTLLTQAGLLLALAGAFLPQAASSLLPALTRALPALTCALGAWLATANVLFVAPLEALRTKPFLAQEMEAKAGPSAGRWRIDSDPDHGVSLGDFDWRLGLSQWELNALTPQFNALFGIETAAIYSSLIRRDYVTAWHAAPQAMGVLFGVRFNLVPGWRVTPEQARAAGFTATALGMWVRELPPQPRVFLAPCVQPEGTFEEAARALAEPGFDVHTRALEFVPGQRAVPGARGECDPAHRQPPLLAVSHPRPERFDVHLQAPTPGMLVLSEEYDPGWTRSLDGGPFEPAARVDLAALGTYVTQGEHQLTFRFWPVGLTPGLLAALSVLLATLAAHLVRTPRSESSSPVRFR
ncbi:MAG: hypothetical protein JST92_25370, partial [Deltaproteobacteria bacterium]|nr:hypothetical protein [Deltaproteobacteria bacterium]